jgi:hypothetical protein
MLSKSRLTAVLLAVAAAVFAGALPGSGAYWP